VPPTAWMTVIFLLSSDTGSAEQTGALLKPLVGWLWPAASAFQIQALHGMVRKAAHFIEYGILLALWYRAFRLGRGWAPGPAGWCALALSISWAVFDETHQSFVPSRTGSANDVLVDTSGALATLAVTQLGWHSSTHRATTVLLWVAALGGAALLLIDGLAGVSSGWLWLTVPSAMLALVVLHRLNR
jgi:VanZ family protein